MNRQNKQDLGDICFKSAFSVYTALQLYGPVIKIILALDSPDGLETGLSLLMSDFPLAENSTEDFGDPLEGTSVWIWNNTGLVREQKIF